MEFRKGQIIAIDKAIDWYLNSSEQVFQISGNPGTGKSVVLNEIINRLGIPRNRIAPMAFTGAASVIMKLKGLENAGTIHSWLYDIVSEPLFNKDGTPMMDTYLNVQKTAISFKSKDLSNIDLMVIDEAGSVPLSMKKDILSKNIKIIVAGDLDQLDPVADDPAFLYDGEVNILNEIMRQAEGSGIVYLAQRAKKGLPIHNGYYGDMIVLSKEDVQPFMYTGADMVLCCKNKTKDSLTQHIRHKLLGISSSTPVYNDKMICRKNNINTVVGGINLVNGLTGRVSNNPNVSGFDGKTFTIDLIPDIFPNLTFRGLKCDYKYLLADNETKRNIKQYGMSSGELFDYGYAMTVHLAQGSQCMNGIYFEEYLNAKINNKLNYTAITRFANSGIYVRQEVKKYY